MKTLSAVTGGLILLALLLADRPPAVSSEQQQISTEDRLATLENFLEKIAKALTSDERIKGLVRHKRQAVDGSDDGAISSLNGLSLEDLVLLLRGRDGRDGPAGAPGIAGSPGPAGADGTDGAPGAAGADGIPGENGGPGPVGANGEQGLPGIPGTTGSPGVSGSVYTRFGRTTCGNATKIYHGFAANTAYNQEGGGVNYQCLPLNPQFDGFGVPGSMYATISGVEYQVTNDGSPFNGKHDQNVPCAQCYTTASAVLMVPARKDCPPGWNFEYEGALMTERAHASHTSTTFECVDSHPEVIIGQAADTNGALFYFVKPICGNTWQTTGHCPPYRSDRKLLCAVCSK